MIYPLTPTFYFSEEISPTCSVERELKLKDIRFGPPIPIYNTLIYPTPFYLPSEFDVDRMRRTYKIMTDHFRWYVLDKWLYTDFSDLLGYFKIDKDGKVELIHKLSDYDKSSGAKDTTETVDKKSKFIEDNILTYDMMFRILKKFVNYTNSNWYNLPKIRKIVKDYIKQDLEKILIRTIEERH